MRIIREFLLNTKIKASLFVWNGKYILKLESGPLEQTYKIPEMDVGGAEEIINRCTESDFIKRVEALFGGMEENLF